MERRELIKCLGALASLMVLPTLGTKELANKRKFHFLGLGTGGANIVHHVKELGIPGEYTCFNWFPSFVEPYKGLKHIEYEYPREYRRSTDDGRKMIPLTNEMKRVLSENSVYIVFVGLGAFTGTSLIYDVLKYLKKRRCRYLAICSIPFECEGRWRNEYARLRMRDLEDFENVVIFENDRITKKYGKDRISRMCRLADKEMIKIFEEEFLS